MAQGVRVFGRSIASLGLCDMYSITCWIGIRRECDGLNVHLFPI